MFSTTLHPDVDELLTVLSRKRAPQRLHFIELFLDPEVIEAINERFELTRDLNNSDLLCPLHRGFRVQAYLGHDVFQIKSVHKDILPMPREGELFHPAVESLKLLDISNQI